MKYFSGLHVFLYLNIVCYILATIITGEFSSPRNLLPAISLGVLFYLGAMWEKMLALTKEAAMYRNLATLQETGELPKPMEIGGSYRILAVIREDGADHWGIPSSKICVISTNNEIPAKFFLVRVPDSLNLPEKFRVIREILDNGDSESTKFIFPKTTTS